MYTLFWKKLYDDSAPIHNLMENFFQLGGSMFIMSIQYLMARDLMCHPTEYADKMVASDQIINQFKQAQSVPALLQMLSTTCAFDPSQHLKPSTSTPNRSLLDELRKAAHSTSSCTTTSNATLEANTRVQTLKRVLNQAANQTSSSSSSDSSDEEPPKKRKSPPPKKRKSPPAKKRKSPSKKTNSPSQAERSTTPPATVKKHKTKKSKPSLPTVDSTPKEDCVKPKKRSQKKH